MEYPYKSEYWIGSAWKIKAQYSKGFKQAWVVKKRPFFDKTIKSAATTKIDSSSYFENRHLNLINQALEWESNKPKALAVYQSYMRFS